VSYANAEKILDAFETIDIALARARATELAVRAAHVLAISRGSRSAIRGDDRRTYEIARRRSYSSSPGRPAIKDALLDLMIQDS